MRKEVLWAIVAGVILGLIVAFGVYRINSSISPKNHNGSEPSPTPASNIGEFKVVLDKPENDDVVTGSTVTVSGLTHGASWVTLSGESGDYTIQADSSGAFSQDVDLIPGVNQIKVTAFEASGAQSATEVLVVYSSSFETRTLPTGTPNANASGTADIRAKIAQDVANTLSRPKAYIGTVTDITDSTIQIKNAASEIEQISINADSTAVVNSTTSISKNVKTTDIAIGDFIVAMGYIDANSVLDAQRILITTAVSEPKIAVNEAKVVSATKKSLTVSVLPNNSEDTVLPDVNTDIEAIVSGASKSARFNYVVTGDMIIYVVTTDSKGVETVRSIFDLTPPPPPTPKG